MVKKKVPKKTRHARTKTDIYENVAGRFRPTKIKYGDWGVDLVRDGEYIGCFPHCEGDIFFTKAEALRWIRSHGRTRELHEAELPPGRRWF